MALRKSLTLRKLRSSCLEECTALIQLIANFLQSRSRIPVPKFGASLMRRMPAC